MLKTKYQLDNRIIPNKNNKISKTQNLFNPVLSEILLPNIKCKKTNPAGANKRTADILVIMAAPIKVPATKIVLFSGFLEPAIMPITPSLQPALQKTHFPQPGKYKYL